MSQTSINIALRPANIPLVASFDIATSVGLCLGHVGEKPAVLTWDLRIAGPSRSRRLLHFSNLCDELFRRHEIDHLRYEAPMPLPVMVKIGAGEETILMLRGLIGVLECCGARADIKDIQSFRVQDARQHVTGQRTFSRKDGKKAGAKVVMQIAKTLGVPCADDNQADAFAGWSYTCGLLNPRIAHLVTPLFAATGKEANNDDQRHSNRNSR
jgi:hypothetical protein